MRGQGRNEAGRERTALPSPPSYFSTDLLPATERLDFLHEEMRRSLSGSCQPRTVTDGPPLRVEIDNVVGELNLQRAYSAGLGNDRDRSHLADGIDAVTLLLIESGHSTVEQGDVRSKLGAGEVMLVDFARPVRTNWFGCGMMLMQLPRSAFDDARLARLSAVSLTARQPLVPLLQSYTKACWRLARETGALPDIATRQLIELADALTRDAFDDGPAGNAARVAAMREVMARSYANPCLTMEHVAKAVGLSERSGHLAFEREALSFTEELHRIRLERAAERLHQGHERVLDVAYGVGFSDASHFHRLFKRRFGRTPGELRYDS